MSFNFNYKQVVDNKTTQTYLRAQSISKDVKNIFENASMITDQMAIHSEIQHYLKTAVSRETIIDNQYYESVFNTLVKIKESNDIHFSAWIANEKANFYIDSLGYVSDDNYDVKNRPWYEVAINSEMVSFTPPYIEWETKEVVVSSIKALREKKEVYGFVVVDIVLDNIPIIFETEKQGVNDKNFLISKDGTYIYHEDANKIINSKITDLNDPLFEYHEIIRECTGELFDVVYEGHNYLMMSYLIDDNGWKVINLIDKELIQIQVAKIAFATTLIFITVLVSSILLVRFSTKRSTKPYSVLVNFAKDIAKGELSKNIPDIYLKRTDEMGKISKSFQVIIDTFRKENVILEEKIKEKNIELETQYKHIIETERITSLGSLVVGIAHEINTPLGVGISSSSYLELKNNEIQSKFNSHKITQSDLKDFLEIVSESTEVLNRSLAQASQLVSSFKQISVEQSSELKHSFNICENITTVILSLRQEYKNDSYNITNNLPNDIELNSYPGSFSQIFTNLLTNSFEHGFAEAENGTILINGYKTDDTITITYEDNGRGVSEEELSKIYDPFYTTNRGNGNTGLGMYIVFNIATQKLNGDITSKSVEGEGIQFTITIPIDL